MCFAYCHIAYISPGSCIDCVKEPPHPPPQPLLTLPSPVRCTLNYKLVATNFLFSNPFSIQISQRGCGFLVASVVDSICKGLLLISKWIDNAELFWNIFLKTTRPIALIFLALFCRQKQDSVAHGHDFLNCKHQPNICKFLSVLEAQILDTAYSAIVEKCR